MLLVFSGFCAALIHTQQRESKLGVKKMPTFRWPNSFSHRLSSTGLSCPATCQKPTSAEGSRPSCSQAHTRTCQQNHCSEAEEPHETGPLFTKVWGSLLRAKSYRDGTGHTCKVSVCRSYLKIFWEAVLVVGVEFWYMLDKLFNRDGLHIIWNRNKKEMHFRFCCLIIREQDLPSKSS